MDKDKKEKLIESLRNFLQYSIFVGSILGMFFFGRAFIWVFLILIGVYAYADWEVGRSRDMNTVKERQGQIELKIILDEAKYQGSKILLEIEEFKEWDQESKEEKDQFDKLLEAYVDEIKEIEREEKIGDYMTKQDAKEGLKKGKAVGKTSKQTKKEELKKKGDKDA